ncbi:MAG: RDD family protein [Chloroflexota bacterium]
MTENSEQVDREPQPEPSGQQSAPSGPTPQSETMTPSGANAGTPRPDQAGAPSRRSRTGQKLTRVTLGSALIAADTVTERLDQLDDAAVEDAVRRRTLDEVLVPRSEWPERFGVAFDRPTRHLMLGMMMDARSRADATVRFLNRVGNGFAGLVNLLLQPVRTRRIFKPIRQNYEKSVKRGDQQVERWRAMGRVEDARSRALAETALSGAAEDTMDELVTNQRIEVFVQDLLQAQTTGIVDEIIEEIRERAVSSDNFFEKPARRILRRPDRSEIAPPGFDPRSVRPLSRRHLPIPTNSLLGNYAGFVSRLLALIVDVALVVFVLAIGSSLLTTTVDVLDLREWFDAAFTSAGQLTGWLTAINGLLIVIGYLVLFWLLTGQTLGMMLMGLRVVDHHGGRLSLWQVILRIIGYFIFPGIFFLGFFWILGDDKREAWHDKLARTYVVYAWDARPDETFLTYSMYIED